MLSATPRCAAGVEPDDSSLLLGWTIAHSRQLCCFSQHLLSEGHRSLVLERERTDVDMELPLIGLKLQATPCLVNEFGHGDRNSETAWSLQSWESEQRAIRRFPEDNHLR